MHLATPAMFIYLLGKQKEQKNKMGGGDLHASDPEEFDQTLD